MSGDLDYKSVFSFCPVARFLMRVSAGREGRAFALAEANAMAKEYFGCQCCTFDGLSFEQLLDRERAFHFLQAAENALTHRKPVVFRLSPAIHDSLSNSFIVVPIASGEDKAVEYLDIMAMPAGSDPSSLQRERDDAISMLASVFDVSEVGIIVTDRHQRIVRINESFVRIYGWSRDDLLGKEFSALITADERDMARRNHDEFMRSGIRSSGEVKLLRHDGTIANALYTTAALELSHGRRFQVTTVMDITMRKQMEITLRLAKEQADAANQAKSTFLANMSHELRTPLNAILGFSEMMIKETFGPLGNQKYREYLEDIHLSARHLLEIINEVLDMSKIEAGRVELDEEMVNVRQLVISVIRMMDSRAFSSGLKITESVDPDLPPLRADLRLVRQILINLVGNAVKYSTAGGIIDVKGFSTESGDLHLIVSDTGIGIPADKIQEALEPFGQVSSNTASGIQGTGLGLPLAKAMAELHGGSLGLESELGKGTRVTVVFPAWRMAADAGAGKKSPLAVFRGKRRAKNKTASSGRHRADHAQ